MLYFSRVNIVIKKYHFIHSLTNITKSNELRKEPKICDLKKTQKKPINFFGVVKHITKVSQLPYKRKEVVCGIQHFLKKDTFMILERLSLVNVEDKHAFESLEDSIQFASQIIDINTDDIAPMYSVLVKENLYLRKDKTSLRYSQNDILMNAKITEENYFIAPPGNIPLKQECKRIESLINTKSTE